MTQLITTYKYCVNVRPYFYELQVRYAVIICDVQEIPCLALHSGVITASAEGQTFNTSLTAYLHARGFRRTNKFTRVRGGWAHAPLMPLTPDYVPKETDVETLGVL